MKLSKKETKRIQKELKKWEFKYDQNLTGGNPFISIKNTKAKGLKAWDRTTYTLEICKRPTGNCQLFSIVALEGLLRFLNKNDEYNDINFMNVILQIMMYIVHTKITSKRVLFVDTKTNWDTEFRQFVRLFSYFAPTNSFVYNSTNGSKLRASIIKLNKEKLLKGEEWIKYGHSLSLGRF